MKQDNPYTQEYYDLYQPTETEAKSQQQPQNLPENGQTLPASNPGESRDDLADFLQSLETIPVDSNTFKKLANQSPARLYRATHREYNPSRGLFVPGPTGIRGFLSLIRTTRRNRQTRITFPSCSIHSFPRSLQPLIKRLPKPGASPHHNGPRCLPTLITALLIFAALATGPLWSAAQAPSLETLDHPHKACKTSEDKETKRKHTMIATSDKPLILKLSMCRENELKHVSCQFTDAAGNDHWLYIPGLVLPAAN